MLNVPEIIRTCDHMLALCDILKSNESPDMKRVSELIQFTGELLESIRGNRSAQTEITRSDMRLYVEGILNKCREILS